MTIEELEHSMLTYRERTVLEDRRSGKTLQAIADEFQVSRERIRQIESKAKRKVNDPTDKEGSFITALVNLRKQLNYTISAAKASARLSYGSSGKAWTNAAQRREYEIGVLRKMIKQVLVT